MDILFEIKYLFWEKPKDWYYNMKWLFRNLWGFRNELWNFRSWDYSHCIGIFARSLEMLAECIKNGHEERRSALKKVDAINELVSLLRKTSDGDDFGCADEFFEEKHLTVPLEEYHKEYLKRKKDALERIYRIIRGQDSDELKGINVSDYDEWVEKFDGTGYEGWWD